MSVLHNLINTIENTQNISDELRENLDMLMYFTDSKIHQLSDKISFDLKNGKTTNNLTVPVCKVFQTYSESYAIVKIETIDIMKTITDVISGLVASPNKDMISNGISKLVANAIDSITGIGEGMQQEIKLCTAAPDYFAIARYDFAIFGAKNAR